MFADLVDSTALSTQVEPETYRLVVGRYREQVLRIGNRYEGISAPPRVMGCWRCSVIRLRTKTM